MGKGSTSHGSSHGQSSGSKGWGSNVHSHSGGGGAKT